MSSVSINAATLRDVTWIAAHMRDQDRREIFCQLPEEASTLEVATFSLAQSRQMAWTASIDGEPTVAIGIGRAGPTLGNAWAFGSKRFVRCVPLLTEFVGSVMIPGALHDGYHRVEARAHADHRQACEWLTRLGARWCCDLLDYGRNREPFRLFAWTRSDWEN